MTWTPATPLMPRTCWMISVHSFLPSAFWFWAPSRRLITSSGMCTPGTLERIHLAVLAEASGPTPTRMKAFWSRSMSRTRAQHVGRDGDAVVVAAGDLEHRRIADAGEKGTDRHRRHVAVRARAVGGVDGIDPAFERSHPLVDVVRVGGIGRVELGRHGEL